MAGSSSSAVTEKVLRRANPSTIQDKFLVGYQGWFTCAGDGEPIGPGHHGWLHWFDKPIPDGGRPNTDLWPDLSDYSASERYPAPGLTMKSGEPAMLFSSRNAKTVQRHFHWMAEHGVDGAFLQRFAGQCDLEAGNEGIRRVRDEVGDRVREAAEREGRVFAMMYDVTGVPADRIQRVLEQDWLHLLHTKRILDSPNYLKEKGRPVVALWGFGFDNANHTPGLLRSIAQFFRNATPGGVYLMGGTPTHWRTSEGDADRNPEFVNVWLNEFDAISPWTIGRYKTEEEAEAFAETKIQADVDLIKKRNEEGRYRRIEYIPVVFPGGSGYHLSEGKWAFNDAPRKGGRFLWKQIFNARRAGAHIIYGAMWDEYDEGTAFLPVVPNKRGLPVSDKWNFLALDADGHDLPSDWYMRICGFAAEGLRGERRIFDSFPSKELQDYWGNRPKYEEVSLKSADFVSGHNVAGGSSGASSSRAGSGNDGETYEEWLANQRTEVEEAPPPPYSLEAEELEAASSAVPVPSPGATAPVTAAASVASPAPTLPAREASVHQSAPPLLDHRTQSQGYYGPQPMSTLSAGGDPNAVTTLTNDFSRVALTPSPQSQPGVPPNVEHLPARVTSSPPPLHSTHPAAQSYTPYSRPASRPQPHTQSSTPTGFQASPSAHVRPSSAHTSSVSPPPPVPSQPAAGGSSQGQWPPPEWGVAPSGPSAPTSQYNQPGGANLTRPQTFTANSYNHAPIQSSPSASSNAPPPTSQYNQPEGANLTRPHTVTANSYNNTPAQSPPPNSNAPAPPAPHAPHGGANLTRPQTFSANLYGGSHSAQPHASSNTPSPDSQYNRPGGALLSRPHTFSADLAPALKPPTGPSRPTSAAATATPPVSGYAPPISSMPASNPSIYGGPPPMGSYTPGFPGSSIPSGNPNSPYSMPGQYPSSYAPAPFPGGPGFPGQQQHSGSMYFPSGPSAYSPYGGVGVGSSFPDSHYHAGGTDEAGYPTTINNAPPPSQWSGGSVGGGPLPHVSPPISPSGMNTFANANSYPGHSQHSTPAPMGGPQFPHAAGGESNYFGNNSSSMMPQGHVSSYPNPQQHGGIMPSSYQGSSTSSYPQSSAGSGSMPSQQMPWMSGGGTGGVPPPSLPPRPSNYTSGSYSSNSSSTRPPSSSSSGLGFSTTSGAGASALGLALSAVDKVAGRRTRDQLESGVGSLAQTGSKLFNKFTK